MSGLKNKYIILLIVLLILFLVSAAASYFLVITPLQDRIHQKQSETKTAEKVLDTMLLNRQAEDQETKEDWIAVHSASMKEKLTELPVASQIQQVLLQFETAEKKSGAVITGFHFTKIIGKNTTGPIDITMNEVTDSMSSAAEGEKTETAEHTKSNEEKMTGQTDGSIDAAVKNADFQNLVELQMDIEIEVDQYYELRDFLKSIENSKRKMTVLGVKFAGREEVTSDEQLEIKSIKVIVSIATFFVTGFDELKPYMPAFKVPEGSGKTNPFPVLTEEMIQQLLRAKEKELQEKE